MSMIEHKSTIALNAELYDYHYREHFWSGRDESKRKIALNRIARINKELTKRFKNKGGI